MYNSRISLQTPTELNEDSLLRFDEEEDEDAEDRSWRRWHRANPHLCSHRHQHQCHRCHNGARTLWNLSLFSGVFTLSIFSTLSSYISLQCHRSAVRAKSLGCISISEGIIYFFNLGTKPLLLDRRNAKSARIIQTRFFRHQIRKHYPNSESIEFH